MHVEMSRIVFRRIDKNVLWLGVEIKEKKFNYGCCV
jgi:hypothetical protein